MTLAAVVSRIAHDACVHSARLMPAGRWWTALESNFWQRPEGFDLDFRDRWRVSATAASDVVIRTAGAVIVGGTAMPMGFHPWALDAAFRDAPFYERLAETAEPAHFFHNPPADVPVRSRKARMALFRPDDGVCEDLSFDSPFEPVNPTQREPYLRHTANRVAHARYWRHNDGPRPTIIAIHGFMADLYAINQWFFALPWFYTRLGCDVLLFTLPFHGPRQTRLSPFSGYGFFAGGPSRINEAFAQAVHDARVFVAHLQRERGAERIGVTGISLGGFTTALLASVERRLSFAIPNVPVVSLPDLVMEWEPIGSLMRALFVPYRLNVKEARRMLAVSSPLTYPPALAKERLMIIGGVGDRLAPPKHSRLLWDHWDRPRLHWFPGSHIIHLDKGEYLKKMAQFMSSLGFLP